MKVKVKKVGTMTNELWQQLDDCQAETISGGVRGEGQVGRIDINELKPADFKYEGCDPGTCC
jgi:hypothetical protein